MRPSTRLLSLCLIASSGLGTGQPLAAATLLHAGRVLDVDTGRMLSDQTIVVDGERIVRVEPGHRDPATGDQVIDLRGHTALPGLMDMHTHLTQEYSPTDELDRFKRNAADVALQSAVFAERTLLAGFTTVRDLGDRFNASIALRNAIDRGLLPGPRIYTSGTSIATTGGHADPTNGWAEHLTPQRGLLDGVADGPYAAAAAVRQRYKDGADLIKITATGGVLSVARDGRRPQFTSEEIAAIVATARDYGFTVAAHAHGTEGIKRAVRAGVDTIEHGTFMDDEAMALMKEHGTWYVPTITAGRWVADKAALPSYLPELVRPKAAAIGPQIQQTFARAHRAGVRILFGTDTGVSAHGENAVEFVFMVEAGMAPVDALRAATILPATFLGVADQLGSLEPGKLADIVATPGNPLDDIEAMQRIDFVMKSGVVYRRPSTALALQGP